MVRKSYLLIVSHGRMVQKFLNLNAHNLALIISMDILKIFVFENATTSETIGIFARSEFD